MTKVTQFKYKIVEGEVSTQLQCSYSYETYVFIVDGKQILNYRIDCSKKDETFNFQCIYVWDLLAKFDCIDKEFGLLKCIESVVAHHNKRVESNSIEWGYEKRTQSPKPEITWTTV